MSTLNIGISGFAAYLPPYTVRLADWCNWTGDAWEKVKAVVGTTFRMCGPNENAYTMAATAALRLIRQYNVDPRSIGYLALGTESSTDNSAGAIIVKGMVNDALAKHGMPELSRACEVPEFKHACLGGIYALKAASRYLAVDGKGRKAIVICSDIAEYQRASSGEPTQGAGAVALLVEENPSMLDMELARSGSSSAYRGVDFRKPFQRFAEQTLGRFAQLRDFPRVQRQVLHHLLRQRGAGGDDGHVPALGQRAKRLPEGSEGGLPAPALPAHGGDGHGHELPAGLGGGR